VAAAECRPESVSHMLMLCRTQRGYRAVSYRTVTTCIATRCGIRIFRSRESVQGTGENRCVELREQVSKERGPKKLLPLIQNLRPRVCHVLSLLRIHSPDCEHCMARLTCGDELRKRLEQLSGRRPPRSRETGDDGDAAANRTGTR
jgi:hypothetical protein